MLSYLHFRSLGKAANDSKNKVEVSVLMTLQAQKIQKIPEIPQQTQVSLLISPPIPNAGNVVLLKCFLSLLLKAYKYHCQIWIS